MPTKDMYGRWRPHNAAKDGQSPARKPHEKGHGSRSKSQRSRSSTSSEHRSRSKRRCDQGARTNQPAGVEHHVVELVEEIHQPAEGRELEKGRQEATIPGVKGVTSLPDVDDPEAEEETNEAEVQR